MKRFLSGIIVGVMIASTVAFAATYMAEDASFKIFVNGKEFTESKAVVIDGRTYLPLRALGDVLSVPVNWNDELHQVEVGEDKSREKIKNGIAYHFDINNDDFTTSENLQNMCAYTISFEGDVEKFSGIQVGKGYNQYQGGSVAIDKTDVKVFAGTSQTPAYTYAHGLTVSGSLSVTISVDYSAQMVLEIKTGGGTYKKTIPWDVRYGTLFVKSLGENTLKNCTLSYACYGLEKDTYIYGNSYLGLYKDRWTKYLIDNGYKNVMLNGYSGRASKEALASLKTDLKYGTPKRIIWAMGMNDGDGSAVNSNWKNATEEVMSICGEKQIELILCTIPNVPKVNNKQKNEYVENSGYRFIDFESAVGAHDGAIWKDGMLADDGIHTAEAGAAALYEQAVYDVPELTVK